METLRVCLLAPEFLPVRGGVGTYSVALVRELSRFADVTVLTLTRRQGGVVYRQAEMEEAVGHRARVLPITEARDTFLYNARFQVELLRRLPAFVRDERIDVVHTQHAHMPDLLGGPLIPPTPVVRTIHTTIASQREAISLMESLGQRLDITERWQIATEPLLRTAERLVLARPGWLFPVCRFTADHLVQHGVSPDRIRVVHNGVDTERFHPRATSSAQAPPATEAPHVLFVGRITLMKGIGILIDAAPKVIEAVPEVRFQLVGQPPPGFGEWLRTFPRDLQRRFEFLGFVPVEQLPNLYSDATVVALPSLADSFPFSVLEAMAAGAPIVASRVGGIPEAIRHEEEGLLVDVGSSSGLAEAIIGLLRDPGKRRRLSANARERARTEFTWARAAQATYEGYRTAIAGFAGS